VGWGVEGTQCLLIHCLSAFSSTSTTSPPTSTPQNQPPNPHPNSNPSPQPSPLNPQPRNPHPHPPNQDRCTPVQRGELRDLSQIFRMSIIDVGPTTMTLEAQGREDKMRAIVDLLEPYGGVGGWGWGWGEGVGGGRGGWWGRGVLMGCGRGGDRVKTPEGG